MADLSFVEAFVKAFVEAFVKAHDDLDIVQAAPDELTAINIIYSL